MPVKSDLNFFSLSPSAMDCDDLSNSGSSGAAACGETLTTTIGAPCDDIWNKFDNFILTPPQSPPVKFDLVSDTLEDELFRDMDTLSSSLSGFTSDCFNSLLNNHTVDVLHDCMWSGQCNEDLFGVNSISGSSNNGLGCSANCKLGSRSSGANSCRDGKYRRENCTLLSGSPMSLISCSFSEIYNACGVEEEGRIDDVTRVVDEEEEKEDEEFDDEDEDDDDEEEVEEEVVVSHRHSSLGKPSNIFVSSAESLKNDHSYGSPASSPKAALPTVTISTTTTSCNTSSNNSNSLILPSTSNKSHHKSRTKERASKQLKSLKVSNEDKSSQITVKFLKRQSCVSPKGAVSNTLDASRRCKLSQSKRTTSTTTTTTTGPTSMLPHKLHGNSKQRSSILDEAGTGDSQPSLLMKSTPKSSKSMYPERRREHNDSERKRRDHLRNAFHYLRDQIPKLKDAQKKPARIVILSEATAFVNSLQEKQRYLERTKEAEIRKREKLFKKLNRLQNECEF